MDGLIKWSVAVEDDTEYDTDAGLEYFHGEFNDGVFRGAVYVSTTDGVSDDHDDGANDTAGNDG